MKNKFKSKTAIASILLAIFLIFPLTVQAENNLIDEWGTIKTPSPPELKPVMIDPKSTTVMVLDIQNKNCNTERRPRCVKSLPKIKKLLEKARDKGVPVLYTVTSRATEDDIREEVFPDGNAEPVVRASVDKFYGTALERLLKERNTKTVIIVGTSAHGAVLGTAIGAAMRKLNIIVPIDGITSSKTFAEQYTVWHLVNAPGTRKRTTLTLIDMIKF